MKKFETIGIAMLSLLFLVGAGLAVDAATYSTACTAVNATIYDYSMPTVAWSQWNSNATGSNTVSGYIYETNITGTAVNSTWAAFATGNFTNTSIPIATLREYEGKVATIKFYANDSANLWNSTSCTVTIITDTPKYENAAYDNTAINAGDSMNVSVGFTDNFTVEYSYLMADWTGTYVNYTMAQKAASTTQKNFTYRIDGSNTRSTFNVKFCGVDYSDASNCTSAQAITVTSAGGSPAGGGGVSTTPTPTPTVTTPVSAPATNMLSGIVAGIQSFIQSILSIFGL